MQKKLEVIQTEKIPKRHSQHYLLCVPISSETKEYFWEQSVVHIEFYDQVWESQSLKSTIQQIHNVLHRAAYWQGLLSACFPNGMPLLHLIQPTPGELKVGMTNCSLLHTEQ